MWYNKCKFYRTMAQISLHFGADTMYKSPKNETRQITLFDFNQTCGMQLDPDNEWIQLSYKIPWDEAEVTYAAMFPSKTGHPAIPLRMALGAYIIQKKKGLSDRKLVQEIAENPYLQFFIGMEGFAKECPFKNTVLVNIRKRLNADFISRINDLYLEKAGPTKAHAEDAEAGKSTEAADTASGERKSDTEESAVEVMGTAILDATCSPSNIRYPQDYSLLNEAREKLEEMIDYFHGTYCPWKKPRTYRKVARKEYLELAKTKKRSAKKIRKVIRKQLGYVRRDLGYLEAYMSEGYALDKKYINNYLVILKLYEQQKYMFDNKTHRVDDRIVSINQPYIRPIVRGKVKTPVEFGAKYDVSIDEKGHARLEKISFDPYNESTILIDVLERYRERTGHYPARILVDQIYRTRKNLDYCKNNNIRMSGPRLGRPSSDTEKNKVAAKTENRDNRDRIEIERFFSLEKGSSGAALITTKLEDTTLSSIAMSVFVTNLFSTNSTTSAPFFILYFADGDFDTVDCQFIEIDDTI